jgi:hypothetical protein
MENVHGISLSANKVLAVEKKIRIAQADIEKWVKDAEVSYFLIKIKMLIKSKIYDEKSRKEKENQHNNVKLLIEEFKLVEVRTNF